MRTTAHTALLATASVAIATTAFADNQRDRDGSVQPDQPNTTTWRAPQPVVPSQGSFSGGFSGGLASGPIVNFLSVDSEPEGDMPREVAFTPDGSAAVIVNRDTDTMTFFDVASRTITNTVGLEDFPVDVAVTPDGQFALATNVLSNSVSIVDIATHTVAAHVPITGEQPYRVEMTADGEAAVVGVINDGVNSSFSVIDLDTHTESLSFASASQGAFGGFFTPAFGIFGNIFTQFAVSPDNTTIVLPDRTTNTVFLYDLTDGSELAALDVPDLPTAVDISDDGTIAVVSHEGSAEAISRIDLVSRVVTDTFSTSDGLFNQVIRITPDNNFAIAGILNNVIFVNLNTGARTATVMTGTVGDIEISFDNEYAFISNFNSRVIDLDTQSLAETLPLAPAYEAATSPVENRAVALNNRFSEDIHLYNIDGAAGFVEGSTLSGEQPEADAPKRLALSSDGQTLLVSNSISRNVTFVDLASESILGYVDTGETPRESAFTPDGAFALVCNGDSDSVSIIDTTTLTVVAEIDTPTRPIRVRISPDSTMAYVTTVAGSDSLYFIELDGANSSVVDSFSIGQLGSANGYSFSEVSGMELSPDGSLVAICESFDDQLLLVDTATKSVLTNVAVGDFPIRVVFNDDGTRAYVANAFGDSISVVDINGGSSTVIDTIAAIDMPLDMSIDSDESFMYVGEHGFSSPAIQVVELSSNSIVATISLQGQPREAHLQEDEAVYNVTTTEGELVRIDAAGASSAIIETLELTASPPDFLFSEALTKAAASQPGVDDGLDLIDFGPINPADLNGDGIVDGSDLGLLLGNFNNGGLGDINQDGIVNGSDLGLLLGAWTG